jgi:peptidoglycan/xylan/chitin deacetylase (PgdA/CDA1 family)
MKDFVFGLLHDLGIAAILRKYRIRRQELAVLMFHRVSDEVLPLWPPLPVEVFRCLMEELARSAHVVPLEKVGEIDVYPDRPLVVLSFDDGYLDFWVNAVPILAEFGLPAHHNICPGLIEKGKPPWTQILEAYLYTNPARVELPGGRVYSLPAEIREDNLIEIAAELFAMDDAVRAEWIDGLVAEVASFNQMKLMGWEELGGCVAKGITIGSHGMSHRNLAKIADGRVLQEEVEGSKRKIKKELGVDANIFSFPNGLHNARSVGVVRDCGYRFALLCEERTVAHMDIKKEDIFHILPRLGMRNSTWQEENLRFLGLHRGLF